MGRAWVFLGGVFGALAVGGAAAAAHAGLAPAPLVQLQAAVQMLGWHALALFGCGVWVRRGGRLADAAGFAFAVGTVLFCGAVAALTLGGLHAPGVAPAGGVLLILGWLLLAGSAVRAV